MAWLLIISGIVLTIYGLQGILKIFETELERQGLELSSGLNSAYRQELIPEVAFKEQQERLEKAEEEMDRLIQEIDWKAKIIKRKMENIFLEVEKSDNPEFNQILSTALAEKGTEILPERYSEIFRFYHNGFKMEEIAEKLDLGVRETELILKMYKKEADIIAK